MQQVSYNLSSVVEPSVCPLEGPLALNAWRIKIHFARGDRAGGWQAAEGAKNTGNYPFALKRRH